MNTVRLARYSLDILLVYLSISPQVTTFSLAMGRDEQKQYLHCYTCGNKVLSYSFIRVWNHRFALPQRHHGAQQPSASHYSPAAAGEDFVAVGISVGAAGLAALEPVAPKPGRAKRGLPAEAPPAQREGVRKRLPSVRLND
eukprot:XP_001695214.1 predicted protein [Chlamydomonas reinhardtii]